jgi:hypothetical protein
LKPSSVPFGTRDILPAKSPNRSRLSASEADSTRECSAPFPHRREHCHAARFAKSPSGRLYLPLPAPAAKKTSRAKIPRFCIVRVLAEQVHVMYQTPIHQMAIRNLEKSSDPIADDKLRWRPPRRAGLSAAERHCPLMTTASGSRSEFAMHPATLSGYVVIRPRR